MRERRREDRLLCARASALQGKRGRGQPRRAASLRVVGRADRHQLRLRSRAGLAQRVHPPELGLRRARTPDDGCPDAGAQTVKVDGDDGVETFTIVGSAEAKPAAGKISNESPVGRALLGKKKGEKVVVKVPAGDFSYTIVEIS